MRTAPERGQPLQVPRRNRAIEKVAGAMLIAMRTTVDLNLGVKIVCPCRAAGQKSRVLRDELSDAGLDLRGR